MRQVPHPLIVGDGKMATHFGHYLTLLGIPYSQWSRKQHTTPLLQALFNTASFTVLLISDSQISPFIANHNFLTQKPLMHFSGALSLENISSAHPLMSFTESLYSLDFYQKIPFITEQHKPNLLDFLPNPFYEIPAESKSYYHMLCTLSGNFSCILWQKFFQELQDKLQLPPSVGQLYLQQITENILQNPHTALTGPLSRGDQHTIHKHLNSLESDRFKNIYQAFVTLFENNRGST